MVRWYEGMFLFDSSLATREPEETEAYLKELLDKHGCAIHTFEKWDDRRLGYEINRVRRGSYYRVVYQQEPASVQAMKRDCNL